jgi:predicted enzyme related to lactoylglutathione lyase
MTELRMDIADVTFDCLNPPMVAAFWSAILGRPIEGSKGPYVWLERRPGAVGVGFQRVTEVKLDKNRLHLDLSAPDLLAAMARVESLGGHRVQGFESGGFLVMADPEGNEFCLVPDTPIRFDDLGHTDYLSQLERSDPD